MTPTDLIGPHSPIGVVLTIAFVIWTLGYLFRSDREDYP